MTTIHPYEDYFHDGAIVGIKHLKDTIIIEMLSAELSPEDIIEPIKLNRSNSIEGLLHLEGVSSVIIDDVPFFGSFKAEGESAGIFDLSIENSVVKIQLEWRNYSVKNFPDNFHTIIIEAGHIWWENLPDNAI